MKIIKEIDKDILTLGACLIPTMGALHAGHIQLIKEGKKLKLPLIVSIFVNPIQFNDKDDFANYPKTIDKDIEILNNLQVDYLFIPDSEYIYPSNGFESIDSGELGRKYEGESRPGHFDGVTTVVNKFFNITFPQITAIISILFMIRFIWNFNKFEDVFLLTGGASGTRTLPINVYQQGFAISDIGMGSAVSIVIVMLLLSFMVIYFRLIGKRANEV